MTSSRTPSRFLKIKVRAGSKRNQIQATGPDSFLIEVKAPASDGRANTAALNLLSQTLTLPTGKLWIVKGAHSPAKIVAVL
ncbi:MAG: DUF167 domain-containing protein [Elusimicrobiota bacterium]|jgi:hypothetical protein